MYIAIYRGHCWKWSGKFRFSEVEVFESLYMLSQTLSENGQKTVKEWNRETDLVLYDIHGHPSVVIKYVNVKPYISNYSYKIDFVSENVDRWS